MNETMEIKRDTLMLVLKTLAAGGGVRAGMPSDDDTGDSDDPFGPYGPDTPVLRTGAAALVASQVINTAIMLDKAFEVMQEGAFGQASRGMASPLISRFVDDFCGTPRRRWPFPWPLFGRQPLLWFGPDPKSWRKGIDQMYKQPQAADLVVAGLQFHKAAVGLQDGDLKQSMEAAADTLLEKGFSM